MLVSVVVFKSLTTIEFRGGPVSFGLLLILIGVGLADVWGPDHRVCIDRLSGYRLNLIIRRVFLYVSFVGRLGRQMVSLGHRGLLLRLILTLSVQKDLLTVAYRRVIVS